MHVQDLINGSTRLTIPRSRVVSGLVIAWLVVAAVVLQLKIGLGSVLALPPGELGGVIAGIIAPLALAGVILLLIERRSSSPLMLDRVAGAAGASVEQAAAVTAELQRHAESLRESSGDATRAVAMTGRFFHQHSQDVAETAAKMAEWSQPTEHVLLPTRQGKSIVN